MFNNRINDVKRQNYYTAPVGLPKFPNPYILPSKNELLNEILNHYADKSAGDKLVGSGGDDGDVGGVGGKGSIVGLPLPNADIDFTPTGTHPNPNPNPNAMPSALIPKPTGRQLYITDKELASIAQNEAYHHIDARNGIRGYDLLEGKWARNNGVRTENIVAYKDKNTNKIVMGIAGTHNLGDLYTDAKLGVGLHSTVRGSRFDEADDAYRAIRRRYPNSPIVIGAHSLGSPIALEVLNRHQDDDNLTGYGFNGWTHPTHNKDSRFISSDVKGDAVAETRAFIQNEMDFIENTIEDPEQAKKAKSALEYTTGLAFGGYGATRAYDNYIKRANNRTLEAYKEAIDDYRTKMGIGSSGRAQFSPLKNRGYQPTPRGGIAPVGWKEIEDRFEKKSGLKGVVGKDGVKRFKLPLATADEEGFVLRDNATTGLAGREGLTTEELEGFVEGYIKKSSDKRLGAARMGAGVAFAAELAPYLLLHHDSKNFISNNAKAHTIKKPNRATVESWKTGMENLGVIIGGGAIAGAGGKIKDISKDIVYEKTGIGKVERATRRYVRDMIDRAKNKAINSYGEFMDTHFAPPEEISPLLPTPPSASGSIIGEIPAPPQRPTLSSVGEETIEETDATDTFRSWYNQVVDAETPMGAEEPPPDPFDYENTFAEDYGAVPESYYQGYSQVGEGRQIGGVRNPNNYLDGLDSAAEGDSWANLFADSLSAIEETAIELAPLL